MRSDHIKGHRCLKDLARTSQNQQKATEISKKVKNQINPDDLQEPNDWQETQGHSPEPGGIPKMTEDPIEGE